MITIFKPSPPVKGKKNLVHWKGLTPLSGIFAIFLSSKRLYQVFFPTRTGKVIKIVKHRKEEKVWHLFSVIWTLSGNGLLYPPFSKLKEKHNGVGLFHCYLFYRQVDVGIPESSFTAPPSRSRFCRVSRVFWIEFGFCKYFASTFFGFSRPMVEMHPPVGRTDNNRI